MTTSCSKLFTVRTPLAINPMVALNNGCYKSLAAANTGKNAGSIIEGNLLVV